MEKRRAPVKREGCGTTAGYQRHIRRKEAPCEACREARNAYARRKRAAEKGETVEVSFPGLRVVPNDTATADKPAPTAMPEGVPEPPSELRETGRLVWVAAHEAADLSAIHRHLLLEACRIADRLDRLHGAIGSHKKLWFELGEIDEEGIAAITISAPLAEARQQALAFENLLRRVGALTPAQGRKAEADTDNPLAAIAAQVAAAREKRAAEGEL